MNSYVANYIVRFRVNTHVTVSLVSRLPVPVVSPTDPVFSRMAALVRTLMKASPNVEEMEEYAELQAIATQLYTLSGDELDHVLSTFPLIPDTTKLRVRRCFEQLQSRR
jgi:hypothetical protein